jgi:hypothetical protein
MALNDVGEFMMAENHPPFRLQMQLWSCNTPQERYNPNESDPKKEIPVKEQGMATPDPVVIIGAARTSIGAFQGDLKELSAPELGAITIRASMERARIPLDSVDEALFGCVLPAGLGQAPARQAALGAGLPASTGAVTINKMCGSGMKAAMLAHDLLLAGSAKIVVAGGMERLL